MDKLKKKKKKIISDPEEKEYDWLNMQKATDTNLNPCKLPNELKGISEYEEETLAQVEKWLKKHCFFMNLGDV
jgi:hypothetical protein